MLRQAGSTGAVGIEIVLALGVGYFGGKFLDEKLATKPYLFWILLLGGIGAAVKALVRVTRQYKKMIKEEDERTASKD